MEGDPDLIDAPVGVNLRPAVKGLRSLPDIFQSDQAAFRLRIQLPSHTVFLENDKCIFRIQFERENSGSVYYNGGDSIVYPDIFFLYQYLENCQR